MTGDRTVWLVGMMGAGKSTVGRLLASRLERRFVDTDAEIERAAGCTVAEIFARDGEAAFRERERAALEALRGTGAVVALGGGAIAGPGARECVAAAGPLVYLRARPDTLLARVGDPASRPLLAGAAPDERLERIRSLLERRSADYESAEIIVDTDDLAPRDVADAVSLRLAEARA